MKPFHFSLESLLVLRRQKERAAQQRYARALNDCEEARRQAQRAVTELAGSRNLLTQELGQGITSDRLSGLRAWCQTLENRWERRKAALDEIQRVTAAAFQEMVRAAKDREALDRFYDKSRRAHTRAVQREEQKTFDELAVQLNGLPGPLQYARAT